MTLFYLSNCAIHPDGKPDPFMMQEMPWLHEHFDRVVMVGFNGVRTMTVGTVSMDMLAVDLTPCPQAGIGTPVELWGKEIKIDDVAAAAGTVGYELMCALALRVPVVTV